MCAGTGPQIAAGTSGWWRASCPPTTRRPPSPRRGARPSPPPTPGSGASSAPPGAVSDGMAAARGGLVVRVDGDTGFEPDAIGRLGQAFTGPEVGAVSGNTKVANRGGLLGRWQHLEYVMGFNFDRRMFDLGECM